MSKASQHKRYVDELRKQLRFLERSSRAVDEGDEDEAVRLASTLRVVFHQTSNSTSLVTHLDFNRKVMLSTPSPNKWWTEFLNIKMDVNSPLPMRALPNLIVPIAAIEIDKWWSDPAVLLNGRTYARKQLILAAANKDGGSHVDAVLDQFYIDLQAGAETMGITGDLTFDGPAPFPQGVLLYPTNAHLALIRQFAHEAMASIRKWLSRSP